MNEITREEQMKNFINEIELKTRLGQDLIQLVKAKNVRTELHILAFDILNKIVEVDGNFKKILRESSKDIVDDLLRQLGVNIAHTGLLTNLLRECTSLNALKDTRTEAFKLIIPISSLEILPPSTAANPEFLSQLIKFLTMAYKNLEKEDLNNQEASRFWSGIRTTLINMLQRPLEDKCYLYQVPIVISATQLLLLLSVKQSVEQDTTNIDALISRLAFEIERLEYKEGMLVYPFNENIKMPLIPKLEHRQELCKSLVALLSSSINVNAPRNSPIQHHMDDEEEENFFLNELRRHQMRVAEDLGEVPRDRLREFERGIIERMRGRLPGHPGEPEEELKDEEEVPHNEAIAVSRRVLESKLIELFSEMFRNLGLGAKKRVSIAFEPIVYSALKLISSIIRDIPTSVPNMISRNVIPEILKYITNNDFVKASTYFQTILQTLSAFTIHEDGTALVASYKIIEKLILSIINEEYAKLAFKSETQISDDETMEDAARQLLTLYSQSAPAIKTEIFSAFKKLLRMIQGKGFEILKEIGGFMTIGKTQPETLEKKNKFYLKSAENVVGIIYHLTNNINSREHSKFLATLNEKNELIRAVLIISKNEAVLRSLRVNSLKNENYSFASHILKYFTSEFSAIDSYGENAENVIIDTLIATTKSVGNLTGNYISPNTPLSDFILNKKLLNKSSDEIIQLFPENEQINVALSLTKWVCNFTKFVSNSFPRGSQDILAFINTYHILLMREVLRFFDENSQIRIIDDITEELNEAFRKNENPDLNKHIIETLRFRLSGQYGKTVFDLYNELRDTFGNIFKSSLKRIRRHGSDQTIVQSEILKCAGKSAAKIIIEASSNKPISLEIPDLNTNIDAVFHNILLINDASDILFGELISAAQLFEFYKENGFDQILALYQQTVNTLIELENKPNSKNLVNALNILLVCIIKFFTNIMNPTNLRMLSSKIVLFTSHTELTNQGFKNVESFIASVLGYVIEGILFQTKYRNYKTPIMFLSQCSPSSFMMLLNVIKMYPNKAVLSKLLQEGSPESSYEEYLDRRRRRERSQQPVPPSMIDHMLMMGFEAVDAEDALRRNDLNIENAITDLIARREEAMKYQENLLKGPPKPVTKIGMRKIEATELSHEIETWLDSFLCSLYESLYSISQYQCKYLLYSLSDFQAMTRPYKVKNAFALLLNELQTLLFSMELSFEFTIIPNDEFPVTELAEINLTEKLKKRIAKYTKPEIGITEQELMVLHKMSALIDVITTFLRLSRTNDLLKIMCENKIARCLIMVLSTLVSRKLIIAGRKLIPKVLILLGMIYKEVHQSLVSEMQEQSTKLLAGIETQMLIKKENKAISSDLLPDSKDTNKLLELLVTFLDLESNIIPQLESLNKQESIMSVQSESDNKKPVFINTEILTAILLLVSHLSKDYSNSEIVLRSGIIQKILQVTQIEGKREAVPQGLFIELVFNLFESPQIIGKYMEKIIKSVLFAKTQWRNNPKLIVEEKEIQELQKMTRIDLDRFLNSMGFLMARNAMEFFAACQRVTILQKEMQKDASGKAIAKLSIALNKDVMLKMIKENLIEIPNIRILNNKEMKLSEEEQKYMGLLRESISESCEILKKTNCEILIVMLKRLIEVNFESKVKENEKKVIPESLLVDALSQLIKTYPESIALLLTYTNDKKEENEKIFKKVNGNNLVSFLMSEFFPSKYLTNDSVLHQDDEWKNKVVSLIKHLTYTNKNLHSFHNQVLLTEMRKRILSEAFRILDSEVSKKLINKSDPNFLPLAKSYSSFSILEGLILSGQNSVLFPRENQLSFFKEILKQKIPVVHICTNIMKRINLHSGKSEILVNSMINVLERITRFNKIVNHSDLAKCSHEMQIETEQKPVVLEFYNEIYNGSFEPMEIEECKTGKMDLEDEYCEEEELKNTENNKDAEKLIPKSPAVEPHMFRRDSEEGSDEEIEDMDRNRRDFFRIVMGEEGGSRQRQQRSRSRPQVTSSELDAVQVQLSSEPADKNKTHEVNKGLSDIYEREEAANTNEQIVKLIKGDVLGEEKTINSRNGFEEYERRHRRFRDIGSFLYRERDDLEEEAEILKQDELPTVSLFGYTMDKQKVSEVLKNQLIGSLNTETIIEEPKKPEEVKKPAEIKKADEVKKVEEIKKTEEKKEPVPMVEEVVSSLILEPNAPEAKHEEEKKSSEMPVASQPPPAPLNQMTPLALASLISSMMGAPQPAPTEERKTEERKEEEKKLEVDLTAALISQRRQELQALVPNLQIEDNNLILQIDTEFLRALTPEYRQQAIQTLIQQNRRNSPPRGPNRGPTELDPATFIATLTDENLRDEALMSASPEFLAALPPEMAARAEQLRERNAFDRFGLGYNRQNEGENSEQKLRRVQTDPLEAMVLVPDKPDTSEPQIAKEIYLETRKIPEADLEAIVRLLYVNTKSKIPLNDLFSNICTSKQHLYKLLNAFLFVLSKHHLYEKIFQSKLSEISVSECVSETKLEDSHFPPICLYRGMEFNHLTYNVVSLRILTLLSSLLNKPHVIKYFFMPTESVEAYCFDSVNKIQAQIKLETSNKGKTPLTEILSLTSNPIYQTSEKHLEALINFIDDLFMKSEILAKKKADPKENKLILPVISIENVKQICHVFYFEGMNDIACKKLAEILASLSKVEENAVAILSEIDQILNLVSISAIKAWAKEITILEPTAILPSSSIAKEEEKAEDSHVEVKLSRILQLMRRLYDGHRTKLEEESPNKAIRLYVTEGDAIDEASPASSKGYIPKTEAEILSYKIRESLMKILRKETLTDAFSTLTELVAIISKKSTTENASRKSQLLLKLVPSIESLIMAYDYHFRDQSEANEILAQVKQIREAKPELRDALGQKLKRAYVFYKFLDKNHKAFNNLIRQMSSQTFQTVIKPFILRFPSLLDFENKRNYFKHEQRRIGGNSYNSLRISVKRDDIFNDSYAQLANVSLAEIKGKLRVNFKGEQAADAGGVTREWYTTLSRAMFNPLIALFKKSAHGNTYQPDPKSTQEPNHLNFFRFIGRIIGKALLDNQYLECYFTRALYKILVGQPLTIQDMQDYDEELYRSLLWLRDNDAAELDSNFTYTFDYFGQMKVKELIPNGTNIKVTNENKHIFINKMCKAVLQEEIRPQIEALQKGLYEIIPKNLLSIFDYRELELLISGLPDIDIIDLRKNTVYSGYSENTPIIVWFWEILETFSTKERAEFLQFVTGTSKVPLDGFKSLPGSSGVQKFQIHKVYGEIDRLPTTHTCFNQLDLPEYPTKEILNERLLKAIKEGAEFLGLL